MPDIKIKHRLNTSTVFGKYKSEDYFPLAVIVKYGKSEIEIPSRINEHLKLYRSNLERITKGNKELYELLCSGYFSVEIMKDLMKNKKFPVYHLLEDEKSVISKTLGIKKVLKPDLYTAELLEKDYRLYTLEITDVFDKHIKNEYLKELRKLFIYSADNEDEKELFRLTDYLIHFINWGNSFYNYYEASFDIHPGHLRKVENRLGIPLRTKIKAYLAFHTHINTLKCLLEKREQGKISTLSVLDWKSDLKQILLIQFASVFGNKKSEEYINALEEIIDSELI